MLQQVVGERFAVVATVPPQHIYGIEMSVLLPLLGDVQVHSGRPFFPSDIASALEQMPEPRVLVTTPVHLRALVESGVRCRNWRDAVGHRADAARAGSAG
jgi:acyl-coenzyme A synthetase/AMP-(fatty) acid ligase